MKQILRFSSNTSTVKKIFRNALTLLFLMMFSYISWSARITGPTQICPGVQQRYGFEPETIKGSCWAVGWVVKDQNGANVPWTNENGSEYTILVTWPEGNGIGSVSANAVGCCVFGCEKHETVQVKIGPQLSAFFTPDNICPGSNFIAGLSAVPFASSYTYTAPIGWLINNQSNILTTTSTSVTISSSSSANGSYPVSVVANGCNGKSATSPIVRYLDVGVFNNFSIVGPTCLLANEPYYLSTNPTMNGNYVWQIELATGEIYYSTEMNPVVRVPSLPNSIYATLSIDQGCGWSYTQTFEVFDECSNSFARTAVEKNDPTVSSFNVFPNPAKSETDIEILYNVPVSSISIQNVNGDIVKRIDNPTMKNKLNVEKIPDGIYAIIFHTKNGIVTKRLIVKNN